MLRRVSLALALLLGSAAASRAAELSTGGMRGIPITVSPEFLFHTLAADFFPEADGTIYVQTGDIPAMWLRDAAAQTLPYVRLARARPMLRVWIRAVIEREMRNIDVDPYANAFRADYTVWERKWEVDSLSYPVVLTWSYFNALGDRRIFTPSLHRALARIVATYDCERRHSRCSRYRAPHNTRADAAPSPAIGLIWSAFRASDDATHYPYNVPEQMFAVTALRDLASLALDGYADRALATRADGMAEGVAAAIRRSGMVHDFRCGVVYAYEVDGRGRRDLIDDANLPSLLGIPLGGFASAYDPVYRRTRACVLSPRNRYYVEGRVASGIGSPHTPSGYVWPLSLVARALTSLSREEIVQQLQALAASAGRGGRIHESFDPNDPSRFTRAEFGWGNAMYAELLFRAAADFPAQPVIAREPMSLLMLPESIAVVDPATALVNRAILLDAFDRAIPMTKTAPDEPALPDQPAPADR